MPRVKIELPSHFPFTTSLPVRITDINYGGHGGNDSILGMIHEGRMRFLRSLGYTEMEFEGTGMIMSDVIIEFRNELFYGDVIDISVAAGNLTRAGFELFYKIEKKMGEETILVANSKTAMVCYDYGRKKIVALPEKAADKLRGLGKQGA